MKTRLYTIVGTIALCSLLYAGTAVIITPTDEPTIPDNGLEVAVSENGEQLIKWCARKVVVDKNGFSDIKRTCGWWTYDGRLIKEIK